MNEKQILTGLQEAMYGSHPARTALSQAIAVASTAPMEASEAHACLDTALARLATAYPDIGTADSVRVAIYREYPETCPHRIRRGVCCYCGERLDS